MPSGWLTDIRERSLVASVENAIILAAFAALYTPWRATHLLLALALLIAWLRRGEFEVDRRLMVPFYLLVGWMVTFSIVSDDPGRSAKGAYDMVRGGLTFFPALLLGARLRIGKGNGGVLWVIVAVLLGHLFFYRDSAGFGFFGFHENPNNAAVTLVAYAGLWIVTFPHQRPFYWVWVAAGVLLLTFIALTGGRGAWLGVGLASCAWLLFRPDIAGRRRLAGMAFVATCLTALLLIMNYKGFGATHRFEIWSTLTFETIRNAPWLGFGLNVVKDVAMASGLDRLSALTAHNLLLEVFVSSGLIGMLWFLGSIGLWVWVAARTRYDLNPVWWGGVLMMLSFLIMGQFDLKLSSFRFAASMAICFGFIHAQRLQYGPGTGAAGEHG